MYCVEICDPLRGKFGCGVKIVRPLKRLSGEGAVTTVEEAVSFPQRSHTRSCQLRLQSASDRDALQCRFAAIRVFREQKKSGASASAKRLRRDKAAPRSKISVLSVRSVATLDLARFHFSKPIFFSNATKRGWDRTPSHMGSIFNSGNQGVCSATARSSQSKVCESSPANA